MKLNRTLILPLMLVSTTGLASEKSTVSFSLDNDGIFGVDQDYTNGLFLSYTTGAITPYPIFEPLSLSFWGGASLDKFEFVLGHKMYTPSDIESTTPMVNDRPYAGFLHSEFNYISLHPEQAQRFNLTLGVTGDKALSEDAQKLVHSITKSSEPNGWAFQVDDSFAGSVGYLTHFNLWRQRSIANTDWEISNVSEINAGNFRSDVSTGFMFRWGSDLGGNMGAANIDNENPFRAGMLGGSKGGWFVFTGIEARYRFNDVTVEGDRSGVRDYAIQEGDDPSIYDVTLKHNQATAVAGFAWYNQSFGATLTATAKTPDYKEAKESMYGTGGIALYAFF
ncbi:lipid A deacylase LpxR family protein [Vibrio europaeus]|uniref:Lipid A deacylase LpxR family protein n=1 Tax=Vibrio europaeus TaxID=300876 RepID=A0AAE7AU32_9VIBR|nr:lipid A-modifier LpxR family protein [Vibrio europaeus]MDC5807111.1 lipid A deacylase LpxR family protein [Vibrio europaeus]MDC5809706.1 lipid A deacylase LpxR family protein [Vibrio europaeus]MDC5827636.1 lipid A deacylase LpxR family protein [Vibrio europaeus]MDC5830480.1 lipid A deacylase LpxR family protein [Vibrio europaeus]MDC5837336.1 lipid A deacylase LpxR family protein [Vibrio europaeus]